MSRAGGYVGKGMPLLDAPRFARGLGQYVNDLPVQAVAHIAFLRSTEAHARIARLDASAARRHPDAIAVFTAEDLEPVVKNRYWGGIEGTSTADYFPLARGKVRWAGEPVAAVVAESRYLAEDIAELIEVEYEPLPAVVDPEKALEPGSALLYEDWGHNVYYQKTFDTGDVDEVFANAPAVFRRKLSSQRHTGTPLEPRGLLADWNRGKQSMTLHANYQDIYLARAILTSVFELDMSRFRIINPDSGGGFGVKLPVYAEDVATVAIGILLGRPVKWIQDRAEDLVGTSQHRDLIVDAQLAHDERGKMLGLRVKIISDGGAYGVPARGNTVEGIMCAEDIPAGGYDLQTYSYDLRVVMTNKAPTCVYRGVAQPVTVFVMDTLMDELAERTGISRAEVREINLVKDDQFPYTPVGGFYVMERGSYVEAFRKAMELIDFDGFPAYKERMRQDGRLVGLGISCGAEAAARGASWYGKRGLPISGQEGCTIKVDPNGKVYAQLGTTTQGQGLETSLAQLIADELGVEVTDVHVSMGDTDSTPYGSGTWASRCTVIGGTAALRAAREVSEKIKRVAAHLLECSVEDLELRDRRVFVKGSPGSSVSLREVGQMAYFRASDMPEELEPALEATRHFDPPSATFTNSTHAVIVEVDPGTGRVTFHRYVVVEDCGTILNPLIVRGQLYGAITQGIGGALYEHVLFDENGQPLCTTFMDYLLPTSLDVPRLELHHIQTPSPHTAHGVKGVGESGTVFAPGAITTGIADALDIKLDRMGLTPGAVHALAQSEAAGVA